MLNDTGPIHDYFAKLGLEPEIAHIYLALQEYGPQNMQQLARNSQVERTRLYRLLEVLTSHHLVEIEIEYKRKLYKAAPISNLRILLAKKAQEVQDLQKRLDELQKTYDSQALHSPLTHVQFYKGQEGVKQMFWNQTKARSESLAILYHNLQQLGGSVFFAHWVSRCNQREQTFRSLAGDNFLSNQQHWYSKHNNEKLQHWRGRYSPCCFSDNSLYGDL